MREAEEAYRELYRPFGCIDLNALDRNIAFVNEKGRGKNIRIATKSVRSVELLRYIAERLRHHSGFMTFDLRETLNLLNQGFDDLLVGYPQLETSLIEPIIPYIQRGKTVTFMIDDIEQWQFLEDIGKKHQLIFNLCIDINVSVDFKLIYFGTKRSSLKNGQDIQALLASGRSFTQTKITGVMGYEAQIAGIGDVPAARWQTPVIKLLKKLSLEKISQLRKEAVQIVREEYPDLTFVNGGGSGSIEFTAGAEEVTEITVGSAFYFPALFSRHRNLPLENAVGFALRVTRKPEQNVVVCSGGGYIASGATGIDKNPVPVWPENVSYLKNEGAGEVQTPLNDKDGVLGIGDTVYFKHAKAGELCERFEVLHARREDVYCGTFNTYRGDGECYL